MSFVLLPALRSTGFRNPEVVEEIISFVEDFETGWSIDPSGGQFSATPDFSEDFEWIVEPPATSSSGGTNLPAGDPSNDPTGGSEPGGV